MDCGSSLPQDLNNLIVVQLKGELLKRGVVPFKGLKVDLVKQLFEAVDEEEPGERLDRKQLQKFQLLTQKRKLEKQSRSQRKKNRNQPNFLQWLRLLLREEQVVKLVS